MTSRRHQARNALRSGCLLVLTSLALTACGSTVQPTTLQSGGQDGALDLGASELGGPTPGSAPGSGSDSSAAASGVDAGAPVVDGQPGALAGSVGTQPGTAAGPLTPGRGQQGPAAGPRLAGGAVPGRGPGVDATTIEVGLLYIDNAGAGVSSLGVQGYSQGDEVGEFRALVEDLNRRGGAAGRKVVVRPRDCGQGCATSDPSALEAACRYFTEDEPVLIVFSSLGFSSQVAECLADKGIGFSVSSGGPAERLMRGRPVYVPDDISLERYALLLSDALDAAGWFVPGAKLGIVRPNDPDVERVTRDVLRPALRSAGAEVVAEEVVGTDANSVVFRLQQKGVTHVLAYGTPLFLMTAAESQQYRPFWSISSRVGPGAFLQGSAPREQLKKAVGPGWQPGADVDEARQPPANGAQKRCLDTLSKANFRPTGTPRAVALIMCGELYHFEQAMRRVAEVSTPGLRAAAETLAPYESPITFQLDFANGRHHGASRYRLNRFDDGCGCFQYVGPLRTIR